jgi:hypothetical protein
MSTAPTWIGLGGPGGRNRAWRHAAHTELLVRHCGHPTALRPYYVDGLLHELGAFPRLAQVQQAAVLAQAALAADPAALQTDEACWQLRATALGLPTDTPMPRGRP